MGLDTYVDVTFKRKRKKIEFPLIYMRKCYSMARELSCTLCDGNFDTVLNTAISVENIKNYLEDLRAAYQHEIDTLCSIPEDESMGQCFDSIWELSAYLQILHKCLYQINLMKLFFNGHLSFSELVDCFDVNSQFSDEKLEIDNDEEYDLGVKDFEYEIYFCNSY